MRKAFLEFKLGRKLLIEDELLKYPNDPRYDDTDIWVRVADVREVPWHGYWDDDPPKEGDQLLQIANEREEDDRPPQFVDEEGVVIDEVSAIRLNKYRALGARMLGMGTSLYHFFGIFRRYRSNRDIFLWELSEALEGWTSAYTPEPPVWDRRYKPSHPIHEPFD